MVALSQLSIVKHDLRGYLSSSYPPHAPGVLRHLFVTQDYAPDLGGMARRHVELCRRMEPDQMTVSTVAHPRAAAFDAAERYAIERQPFAFAGAKVFGNQVKWAKAIVARCRQGTDVIHLGNIRPCGYAVSMASRQVRVPYIVYVYGGDLLHESRKIKNPIKRLAARDIMGRAAGIVSISRATTGMAESYLREIGVSDVPIASIDLGTDPEQFHPRNDRGALRDRLGMTGYPLMVTVARLVAHKGQDVAIRALAQLLQRGDERLRSVRYLIVGAGPQEGSLRALAESLGVAEHVIFGGILSDNDIAEAYATADLYVGLSRASDAIHIEGFGISFVEAGASGTAVLAGDSGGVRSAVRDGETGFVVDPQDVDVVADAMQRILTEPELRRSLGAAGRTAVETHYNWERVARETLQFTVTVAGRAHGRS